MRATTTVMAAFLFLFGSEAWAAEAPLFPFVISYDSPENVTNLSAWPQRPAGKFGFVRDSDGHLATDAGPLRFWGANLCFDACFPSHEQAERLAARLARLGINCVRMHHMDAHSIWGDSANKLAIDPKKLERLDYLIYQLKLHGVYTNLNLHVSRWFGAKEGFPNPELRPEFDKGIDNFEPRMIELQKKYARDLLTHVNPYTQTPYTDEPAVAFIEISNEDALFAVWHWGKLDHLPDPYATTFRKLWNAWLQKKYGNTQKLLAAWGAGNSLNLGAEMLRNGEFTQPLDEAWAIERDAQTKAEFSIVPDPLDGKKRILRAIISAPGSVSWNPQLIQRGLNVKKGASYTLAFRSRSTKPLRFDVQCGMAHEPWKNLGFVATIDADPQWREHRLTFIADRDDANARVAFNHFEKDAVYELADVSMRPGGIVGVQPGRRLEDDSIPTLSRLGTKSPAGNDFCDFLWDTERDYWQGMFRFLKDDLQVHSLVCGTQLGYSPVYVQSGLDYLDNHAYWQHPAFPNRPWDNNDWYIEDIPLVNNPGGTLAHLAMARVFGKPYTISEYNHPAPNSYAAEGFPMLAAFGAFQNWDGIYSFAYSHNHEYEPRRITSFFDLKSNTAQLAHMPACAAMFVRGDVAPSTKPATFRYSPEDERRQLYETHNPWILTAAELLQDAQYPLLHATALDLKDRTSGHAVPTSLSAEGCQQLAAGRFTSDTGEICWDITEKDAGYFTVNTPRTKLFTGFVRGRTFPLGNVILKIGPTRLDWATISISVIDGQGFDRPGRILIAATGWMQNRNAKLEHLGDHRITLRHQWGQEPVLCEGIPAAITLPVPVERAKFYPLDEAGNRREPIPVGSRENHALVELDPRRQTVWYEVEILPPGH